MTRPDEEYPAVRVPGAQAMHCICDETPDELAHAQCRFHGASTRAALWQLREQNRLQLVTLTKLIEQLDDDEKDGEAKEHRP